MRTVSKDIMMICKGWYTNREKISERQAVESYIREYLEIEPYGDCVIDILHTVVNKYFESDKIVNYFVEQSQKSNRSLPAIDFMIESFIHLLTFKVVLKMDLSDYEEIQEYVSNEFTTVCLLGECKPWWIFYKNDEVEDDL